MAAFVVKEYLLPIFESDGKKILKMKNSEQSDKNDKDFDKQIKESTTVFSELKLSGILLNGINDTKQSLKLKE